MCLGIPMQIMAIDGYAAHCEARGARRDISLLLLEGEALQAGDYIVAHLGYAIRTISPEEAATAWELFDAMLEGDPG